jgi:hypothetical protein
MIFYFKLLFLIILTFLNGEKVFAINLDIAPVTIYATSPSKSWQEKLDVDCKTSGRFTIYGLDELRKMIVDRFVSSGLEVDKNSKNLLSIYITDYSCNENGLEDNFQSPLGLYSDEDTRAQAFLRVVYELSDKNSKMLLDSGEITVIGENSEEKGNFTWYLKEHRLKHFNPEKAWIEIVDRLVKKLKRFV